MYPRVPAVEKAEDDKGDRILMSLDEMVAFLKAVKHRFRFPYLDAWNVSQFIESWEEKHRLE